MAGCICASRRRARLRRRIGKDFRGRQLLGKYLFGGMKDDPDKIRCCVGGHCRHRSWGCFRRGPRAICLHQGAGAALCGLQLGRLLCRRSYRGSWTSQNWTNTADTTLFGDLAPGQGFRQRGAGVFGGGQIGCSWQASNYVFGLEGTISGMDNHGTAPNTVFGAQDDVFSWRTNWMATVTGRAGIAVNNNLFYAKGGYAGASSHMAVSDTVAPASAQARIRNGRTAGRLAQAGNTALPRTGSSVSNTITRPSRPRAISSPAPLPDRINSTPSRAISSPSSLA